jgi:hypothetical protein
MRYGSRVAAALAIAASAVSAPVFAESAAGAPARDPNEKVCESYTQIGSRLAKKKVCATRAEWVAIRKEQREMLDFVQRQGNMGCTNENSPVHAGQQNC